MITLIIPLYNSARFIEETLQAVQAQTYTDWECIVVDDGSTDNGAEIVQRIAQADTRIRYVYQSNQGGCVARNEALKHIAGDYVQYLDADDMLDKDKLAKQLEYATNDDILQYGTCVRLSYNGNLLKSSMAGLYKDFSPAIEAQIAIWQNHFNSFQYSSYLVPRAISDMVGEWNVQLKRSQDSEYMARVLALAKKLVYVPDAIFYYRQVENSVSGKPLSRQQMQSEAIVCDVIADAILAHMKSLDAKRACEIHYTDVLTAWYPQNKFVVKDMLKAMKARGLKFNFENRGRLFHILKNIFGWRAAVIITKWRSKKLK